MLASEDIGSEEIAQVKYENNREYVQDPPPCLQKPPGFQIILVADLLAHEYTPFVNI